MDRGSSLGIRTPARRFSLDQPIPETRLRIALTVTKVLASVVSETFAFVEHVRLEPGHIGTSQAHQLRRSAPAVASE